MYPETNTLPKQHTSSFRARYVDYQGMTVKELAAKSMVAKGALDSYLGKQASMPPADSAVRIATAMGVTVEYLVNGHDNSRTQTTPFFSNPTKRLVLHLFDELLPEDQKLALNIVKLLKKNRDEKTDSNAEKHLISKS